VAIMKTRVLAASVFMLTLASIAHADDHWLRRPETIATIAGSIGDSVTTEWAINNNANATEGNPIMGQSTAQRIAVKIAGATAILYLSNYLSTHGHPRIGKVLGWTNAAGLAYIAKSNIDKGRGR
jgi:hypothetical protein